MPRPTEIPNAGKSSTSIGFKCALRNGGEFAEAFFEHTTAHQLFYQNRRLDRISSGIDAGIGLRVIYGTQSVYGYTTDLTQKGLEEIAETLNKVVAGKVQTSRPIAFENVVPGFSLSDRERSGGSRAQRQAAFRRSRQRRGLEGLS